jgi:hypothetical protein
MATAKKKTAKKTAKKAAKKPAKKVAKKPVKKLISRVLGAYRVADGKGEYVVAWGINNTSFSRAWLVPRGGDPCSFDFRVVPGPLQVLTPAAAIVRVSEGVICEWIYVYGQNGKVTAK